MLGEGNGENKMIRYCIVMKHDEQVKPLPTNEDPMILYPDKESAEEALDKTFGGRNWNHKFTVIPVGVYSQKELSELVIMEERNGSQKKKKTGA
jgi:hypothetical protein